MKKIMMLIAMMYCMLSGTVLVAYASEPAPTNNIAKYMTLTDTFRYVKQNEASSHYKYGFGIVRLQSPGYMFLSKNPQSPANPDYSAYSLILLSPTNGKFDSLLMNGDWEDKDAIWNREPTFLSDLGLIKDKNGQSWDYAHVSLGTYSDSLLETTLPVYKYDGTSMDLLNYFINDGSGDLEQILGEPGENSLFDKSVGYLHNLKKDSYVLTNDAGTPIDTRTKFSWDDSYPDYTSDYKVQVNAVCTAGVKNFFGLGKPVYHNSQNIYVQSSTYKDLKTIIENNTLNVKFGSFIQEVEDSAGFGSVMAWQYTYYFRIYVYDESIQNYRCGQWLRYSPDGDVFDGSIEGDNTVGGFDKDGNWVVDSTTDYGPGQHISSGSGFGESWDDAEKSEEEGPIFSSDLGLSWFLSQLKLFKESLSNFPEFINSVIGYLPSPVIVFIGVGIVAVIILRFLGR